MINDTYLYNKIENTEQKGHPRIYLDHKKKNIKILIKSNMSLDIL
jgi:uncharacterized Zn-finger protein